MAVTQRGTGWGGASNNTSELLLSYVSEEIKVLEPELRYARLGLKRDAPKGYDRILFPQTNQLPVKINTSMVTVGGPGGAAGGGSVWGAGASIQGGGAATAPGFLCRLLKVWRLLPKALTRLRLRGVLLHIPPVRHSTVF